MPASITGVNGPMTVQGIAVTAKQMQAIESWMFTAQMPVAALMEKVSGRIAAWVMDHYGPGTLLVIVGPGHNGGDALVVARELYHHGYSPSLCVPLEGHKALTGQHLAYAKALGIPVISPEAIAGQTPDVILDGLFGFGLSRPIDGELAQLVDRVNALDAPIISIDLPSGIHTDSGAALGTAVRASHTLCLGLWKRAFVQDQALAYLGQSDLIEFDIPPEAIAAGLDQPSLTRVSRAAVAAALPLRRSPTTYKYREGHLLLVCGSETYLGAALLTGLAARASGVGMLTIAVPQSLKPLLAAQIPDAVTVGCPTTDGAIAAFPEGFDWGRFDAIACGPGLTQQAQILPAVLATDLPLLLDADGLNLLAQMDTRLSQRRAYTLLTPHAGEFQRLFPAQPSQPPQGDRIGQAQAAAQECGGTVLLKGACAVIAAPNGQTWVNPHSTPALARGGSGDVLTGVIGGLMAQLAARGEAVESAAWSGAWWHAQAALRLAATRGVSGVDAHTLATQLAPLLPQILER